MLNIFLILKDFQNLWGRVIVLDNQDINDFFKVMVRVAEFFEEERKRGWCDCAGNYYMLLVIVSLVSLLINA